jgi:alpha-1,2-mannosyltransferase
MAADRRTVRVARRDVAVMALLGVVIAFAVVRAVVSWSAVDFDVFVNASRRLLRGQAAYADPRVTYPPSALVLFAPFAVLPRTIAHACALVLSVASIAWGTSRFVPRRLRPAAAGAALLTAPAWNALFWLNVNGLLVAAIAVCIHAAARGRWRRFAVALGLSIALKPVAIALVIVALLARRPLAALGALTIPAALSIMAALVAVDPFHFVKTALPVLLGGSAWSINNVSIAGVTRAAGTPGAVVVLLQLALVGSAAVLVHHRWRRGDSMRVVDVATVLLATSFLVSPLAWRHYGVLLLPGLASLVARPRRRSLDVVAAILVAVPWVHPLSYSDPVRVAALVGWFVTLVAAATAEPVEEPEGDADERGVACHHDAGQHAVAVQHFRVP